MRDGTPLESSLYLGHGADCARGSVMLSQQYELYINIRTCAVSG